MYFGSKSNFTFEMDTIFLMFGEMKKEEQESISGKVRRGFSKSQFSQLTKIGK